jgi:hypothetical protein
MVSGQWVASRNWTLHSNLQQLAEAQLHFGLNGTVLSNGMHEPGSPAHGAAAVLRSPVSFRTGRHLQSSAAAPDVRRGNIAGRRPSLQMQCTNLGQGLVCHLARSVSVMLTDTLDQQRLKQMH